MLLCINFYGCAYRYGNPKIGIICALFNLKLFFNRGMPEHDGDQYRAMRFTSRPASLFTRGEEGVLLSGAGSITARVAASRRVRFAADFQK